MRSMWDKVSSKERARATTVEHVFHGGTACGRKTLPRLCSHHEQHGAAPTKRGRREEGHFSHWQIQRAEEEERGWGAATVRYAIRGRCGHRIAIIRRAGEDDDGDRDGVLVVRAYGIRGKNGDNVPGNQRRWGRCPSQSMQPARYTNERSSLSTWAGLSPQTEALALI